VVRHPHAGARAWNNLGHALEREYPARAAQALQAYERALVLDPADYKAAFNRQGLCRNAPATPGCGQKKPDGE
jgi:hypothetical protein